VSAVATIKLHTAAYPYLEEVNEGVLREFRRLKRTPGQVLDVGCGRGVLGKAIRDLGGEVWGIERNTEACAMAHKRLDRVIDADLLDEEMVHLHLGSQRFDAIVFSDVLEHLYDPLGVVRQYAAYLRPGGRMFVSVPNAVVWTNRLLFLCGWVEYTNSGVMDRTHIRFFTFRSSKRLIRQSGLRLDRVSSTPHLVRAMLPLLKKFVNAGPTDPNVLLDSRPYQLYMKWVYPVERVVAAVWPGLLAFRIILVASKPA
jgi:2-polyprenyl-3-methyl-5-hydroxy-6-metoxy-1,4-benzoquinol methylase